MVGLSIGLAGSLVTWWLVGTRGVETASQQTAPPKKAVDAARRASPQTQPPTPPRFDFYRLLPKMEVVIPEEEINEERAHLPSPKNKGPFIIQAGSFRRLTEADSLKARLALMGIESDIQTIIIGNGQTWHRVRIGPFRNIEALRRIRHQLRRAGIEFVVIELSS